ncbi:ras-related protein Rab-1B-like isoform X2 [Myripristis murdjan]|uniref:ras-related protein Rab-1B-like isoform X2 n=1 Tax=Myripristis murdjan TaxID=586833 RepID=UPI001175DFA8|nr:ras-related protein Rab-1B-like isoform X2 [Myripristis murdjan]
MEEGAEAGTGTSVEDRLKMKSSEPEPSDCLSVGTDGSMEPPIGFKQEDRLKEGRRDSASSGILSMKTDHSMEPPLGFTRDTTKTLQAEASESAADCPAHKTKEHQKPELSTDSSYSHCFRVLLAGDAAVGKTCLMHRFLSGTFESFMPNTERDRCHKTVELYGKRVKLMIIDVAGQERFRTLNTSYYRLSHGFIIIYDVTNKSSFDNLKTWLWDIETRCDNDIFKVLVANKTDQTVNREVDNTAAQKLASGHDMPFIETSALTGDGVDEAFLTVTQAIMKHRGLDQLHTEPAEARGKQTAKCLVS